jgi:hypothetical protein
VSASVDRARERIHVAAFWDAEAANRLVRAMLADSLVDEDSPLGESWRVRLHRERLRAAKAWRRVGRLAEDASPQDDDP